MRQALYSVALFVGAALLFWIQLFTSKMLLPTLGGSAAVWNTCLVFFQVSLLVGYLWAHALARWLPGRLGMVAHIVLLAAASALLPVSVVGLQNPPTGSNPIPWLLETLLVLVGPPFVFLAATAPTLQAWFARTGDRGARDPYFLYAASNLGSLAALISYPSAIEPSLPLAEQSRWWSAGYLLLIGLTAICALLSRGAERERGESGFYIELAADEIGGRLWLLRLRWVLLACLPSSLLLGVTSHLTSDVAAVPLLWVIPLVLYLLSFVLAFQRLVRLPEGLTKSMQALLLVPLAVTLLVGEGDDAMPVFALHLAAFFATALLCHQEVARLRPSPRRLTEFYLFIALGGALGGMFNALLAPLVFARVIEYPLALVVASALRPGPLPSIRQWRAAAADILLPALMLALILLVQWNTNLDLQDMSETAPLVLMIIIAGAVFGSQHRPIRFSLGLAAMIAGGAIIADTGNVLTGTRNFYGVLRVLATESPPLHTLVNGTTPHGSQSLDPEVRLRPLSYYHRDGPLGQLFEHVSGTRLTRRVAVVGLGAGAIACYERAGEAWTFFDINPAVIEIAENAALFTFTRDCPGKRDVVLGDARLSLTRQPDAGFDMIILDAFNSDAIPVHLMTRDAVQLYLAKLRPGGLLVFHVSNRYLTLAPVLGDVAGALTLTARRWSDDSDADDTDVDDESAAKEPKDASEWVIVARNGGDLKPIDTDDRWEALPADPARRIWTDEYSNVLGTLLH